MYKIILADDHPITLLGTETFLNQSGFNVVGTFTNGIACLNGILAHLPEIAIIDVSMPGMSGLEVLANIKSKNINTKVILQTMHKEISVFKRAIENKADGYLLKDDALPNLKECIEWVLKGKSYISPILEEYFSLTEYDKPSGLKTQLTKQEIKIVELVTEYKSNKEIAEFLFISEKTVEAHKRNITEKLGLPKGKNVLLKWAKENL